ncbi:MAG: desaturase [Archangium sp.]|nr:desaturase [Archangium sp.]
MSALVRKGTAPGRHVYDVIVVGGQLGGVLATALFARRGLQVLHVPHDGLSEPYTHGDAKLPFAPFFLPPLKAVAAFDETLHELGLTTAVARALHAVPLQLLEQDRWFELSHDEKRRGPELARVFGADAEGFDELMRKAQAAGDASDSFFQAHPDLPPEGLFGRWKFKRQLARFPGLGLDTPLPSDALVRKLATFIGSVENPGTLSRARTLGRALAGPAIFQGGREGLWQVIADRARELGADVLASDEAVERLVLEGGTTGVRLTKNDTIYRAGFVVAATDLDVLTRLVPEKLRKAAAKVLPTVAAQKALLTLNLVLPERALPRGLGALALVDAPGLEGGALLLQVGPATKPDDRVMTVQVIAPLALRSGGEPAIRALISQVHAALARVMPFTRPHLTLESTPWIDAVHVVAGRAEVAPLFQLPPRAWLGAAGLTTSSPWKHVLLAGRQVLPGLGFEGEVLAAQRAVKMVESSLKKNDPLKTRKPA